MGNVILIVLDSLGIGAMPDAKAFGDSLDANTLAHVLACSEGFDLYPNLTDLGLFDLLNEQPQGRPNTLTAKMKEKSKGKDTIVGHWELCGIISDRAFPVYPNGFPSEVIKLIETVFKQKPLGNYSASGTEIINQLGDEHLKTGAPILYTSSDSVLQIAAHEAILSPSALHEGCEKVYQGLTNSENRVARVIARPFTGDYNGNFVRTKNRKDFTVPTPKDNLLTVLLENGINIHAIGKIQDIFSNITFTTSVKTADNQDGLSQLKSQMKTCPRNSLIFCNLVDFDMLYGHRRDCPGYAKALEAFDDSLPEILGLLQDEDLLIITADHGCDPRHRGSDHTREYVPLILYQKKLIGKGAYIGVTNSFSTCAAYIANFFSIDKKNLFTLLPGGNYAEKYL